MNLEDTEFASNRDIYEYVLTSEHTKSNGLSETLAVSIACYEAAGMGGFRMVYDRNRYLFFYTDITEEHNGVEPLTGIVFQEGYYWMVAVNVGG